MAFPLPRSARRAGGLALLLGLAWALAPRAGVPANAQGKPPQEPPAASARVAAVAPSAPLSPRNANYSIDVRLDPEQRTLTGRAVLTWRNIANISTSELRFHLYYNAWKNTRSTWMRERLLGRSSTVHSRPEADWGWIDVTAVRLLGAGDAPPLELTSRMQYISPDNGDPDDQTVLAVPLPADVGPGETINLELEWTSRVPRTFSRTGAIGNFFFLAQWFPKVGILEDTGWNCHQFHTATEFFADYGVYDVRIRAPTGWVVGATGVSQSVRDDADGTTMHRYFQADVHDFAWTTSPDYLDLTERFEDPLLPDVDMRLLLQPEHAEQADRHFAATRATLKHYGEWFGPYPYGQITIIDPAWQSGAGGMEYPTLFTAGTRWLAPRNVSRPEGVTIHEAGHQFWYGIVGNNEFEHAWLDEGVNTFSTARAIDEGYPPFLSVGSLFRGVRPMGAYRHPIVSRNRRQSSARVPGGSRDGRAGDADLPVLAWDRQCDFVQQDGPVAAHARETPGLAHATGDHGDVLRALAVQTS